MEKSWVLDIELSEKLVIKNDLYNAHLHGEAPSLEVSSVEILISNRGYGDRIILRDDTSHLEIIRDIAISYINNTEKIVIDGILSEPIEFSSMYSYGINLFFDISNIGSKGSLLCSENGNICFLGLDGHALKNIHFKNSNFSAHTNLFEILYSHKLSILESQVSELKKANEEIQNQNKLLENANSTLRHTLAAIQSSEQYTSNILSDYNDYSTDWISSSLSYKKY